MVRVKICGIQSESTARIAADAGADFLGFVFAPSRRRVTVEQAQGIIQTLPSCVHSVGVFVDTPLDTLIDIAHFCQLDYVQVHGKHWDPLIQRIPVPVIRAVPLGGSALPTAIPTSTAAYCLYDTWHAQLEGGTGQAFDWRLLKQIDHPRPFFIAGGLHAGNVREAIQHYHPFGVDVSSGVETDGTKDPEKMIRFIRAVKEEKTHAIYHAG